MRRNFILVIGILMLFSAMLGCGTVKNEVKIKTDVTKYSPLMSSVQGIGMMPEFVTNQKNVKAAYHWRVSEGWFYMLQDQKKKELINSGGKLTWIPDLQDNSKDTGDVTISLEAVDAETGKVLAQTSLTLEKRDMFYIVKPNNE